MGKRRTNKVDALVTCTVNESRAPLSLIEARQLFLQDIRGMAKQTQRWHRENLNALVKIFDKQGIEVGDVTQLIRTHIHNHFVFYMLEEMKLKVNTINGRIRSVRAMTKFLHKEGYIAHDFGQDLGLLKGNRVVIQTFSEEQISVPPSSKYVFGVLKPMNDTNNENRRSSSLSGQAKGDFLHFLTGSGTSGV